VADFITSRFDATTSASEVIAGIDLHGKVALVTGGASGIGLETSRALAAAGADLVIADIDAPARDRALGDLRASNPRAKVASAHLDLGSLSDIVRFAGEFQAGRPRLDILVNNAGLMAPPFGRTTDGHELQFGINYLGHHALSVALLPALGRSPSGGRVVCVSSIGHRRSDVHFDDPDYRTRPYDRWEAYGQSKTCSALLAVALTEIGRAAGIASNAVNPGGSMTGLQRYLTDDDLRAQGWIDGEGRINARWRSAAQCAATSVWAATAPELSGIGGLYLENCRKALPWRPEEPMVGVKPYALSKENARRLWEISEHMTRQ
jgi:NAD(P)-dependent dehydrogenase (short-subunit alcohol dehydrogenase family)